MRGKAFGSNPLGPLSDHSHQKFMSPPISPDLEAPAENANRNSARETLALARVIRKGKHERSSHVDLLGRSTHSDMDTLTEEYQEAWQRQEKERRKKIWYIILHNGKPRLSWDGCLAIILCILSFYIPYRVCFFWEQESYDEESILIFESVIDCKSHLPLILVSTFLLVLSLSNLKCHIQQASLLLTSS
jgi:hypothetical protein